MVSQTHEKLLSVKISTVHSYVDMKIYTLSLTKAYIVRFQKWKKIMDLFSSTFVSFNIKYNILPNLDENDTVFLYREQNEQ